MALSDYESWAEEARELVWTILEADTDWIATFGGGTPVTFRQSGLLERLLIEASRCPILAIFPTSMGLLPLERDDNDDETFRIGVQLVDVADECVRAEKLFIRFRDALAARWEDFAALRNDACQSVTLTDAVFEFYPSKEAARPLMEVTTELVIAYSL